MPFLGADFLCGEGILYYVAVLCVITDEWGALANSFINFMVYTTSIRSVDLRVIYPFVILFIFI